MQNAMFFCKLWGGGGGGILKYFELVSERQSGEAVPRRDSNPVRPESEVLVTTLMNIKQTSPGSIVTMIDDITKLYAVGMTLATPRLTHWPESCTPCLQRRALFFVVVKTLDQG